MSAGLAGCGLLADWYMNFKVFDPRRQTKDDSIELLLFSESVTLLPTLTVPSFSPRLAPTGMCRSSARGMHDGAQLHVTARDG